MSKRRFTPILNFTHTSCKKILIQTNFKISFIQVIEEIQIQTEAEKVETAMEVTTGRLVVKDQVRHVASLLN